MTTVYAGNEPNVNRVCFCLPFPFFPLPAEGAGEAASASASVGCGGPPPPQTGAEGGAGFPRIFRNDTFPLTGALVRDAADEGNSGKRELFSFGGGGCGVEVPDPGLEPLGSGITVIDWFVVGIVAGGRNPLAELEDQGVFRWPCR